MPSWSMSDETPLGAYGIQLGLPLGNPKARELKQAILWEIELMKTGLL